jgi:hypothetical protein
MSDTDTTTATQVPIPGDPPCVGGGTNRDSYCFGGLNVRIRPKTWNAHPPTDFKSTSSVEHFCMIGLPENKKLALEESKGLSFTTFVSMTRSYIEDTIFCVYDPVAKNEVYLLEGWGSTKETDIFTWVQTLQNGLLKENGTRLPACTFDGDNLSLSGTAILASISIELWESIEKDLGYDTTGPGV